MAPIHENAEHADTDEGSDGESYIEEEIIDSEEDDESVEEEISEEEEEEVEEEEITEDDESMEEEVVDEDESDDESAKVIMDKKSNPKSEARSKLLQEIATQRKLAENLKSKNQSSDLNRKQALAKLRRQAARDELARNNSKLKAEKVARSTAGTSAASSLTGDVRKKASMERIQASVDVEKINAVEIPPKQTPVSPLQSGQMQTPDDSSRSIKDSSHIANMKSKLKPAPFLNRTSSHSRVTEWIREDPMEIQPASNGAPLLSEENIRNGVASEKIKTPQGSVSDESYWRKKQPSFGKQRSFGQSVGSQSGSIPLKSRSNDMSISSSTTSKVNQQSAVLEVNNYYSLAQLQAKSVDGIDGAHREKYLSPKEFEANFKMTKEEFHKLPRWKQSEAKKALNLF
ncbi:unnamed protein product [Cylindrotheca closterium]|uniref:HP domain-containing protein n=1 Tax=Cylindrotheca closterium TaxID=2856 RepID=A0AAD2GA60_9STRA|nr:unnamed protein product [Cylindrotheca closterium]